MAAMTEWDLTLADFLRNFAKKMNKKAELTKGSLRDKINVITEK